ncbi:hypothetical protein [Streptomyces sp. NPDC101393]
MRIGMGQFLVCDYETYERSATIAQAEAEAEAEARQAYYEARRADD